MIIKLKGADFSSNNINALLNSYFVSITGGSCVTATTSISSISKDTPTYSNTFTVNTDYSVSNVEVTMGGSVVSGAASATTGEAGTAITISVPTVTGNISIKFTYTYSGVEEPDNPGSGDVEDPDTPSYFDITTQGTIKGSIKDGVINMSDSSSLYYLTKVALPSNATSVEYQAFKTGGSYGSAFANDAGTVVKFLPRTDITTGDRVTETVPSGATWFYHMWDDPNNTEQEAPAFTYIRVYTEGEIEIPEGLPLRITEQTQQNYGLLNAQTGVWTVQSYGDTGGQTVTVCDIPAGATTVNYQMFKTGSSYGSAFFDASGTFVSGHVNKTEAAGTRKTLSIPAGAATFWHMYPNRVYANGDGNCPEFDYIEFA